MWSIIISLSLYFSGSFSRRNANIDSCNWISDPSLAFLGSQYSISLGDSAAYCNSVSIYNETGHLDFMVAWYYSCDPTANTVTKYTFPDADKCIDDSPYIETWTSDKYDFNCDASFVDGACLMQATYYYPQGESCSAGTELAVRYGVNGACEATDEGGYRLSVCSDCRVQDDGGYTIESYDDSECAAEATGVSYAFPDQCSFGVPFVVSTCEGKPDEIEVQMEAFEACDACATEIDDCLCSSGCMSVSSIIYEHNSEHWGSCSLSADGGTGVIGQHLCNDVDCEAEGVFALFDCVVANECFDVFAAGNSCDCSFDECAADAACLAVVETLDFDNSDNIFEDIHVACEGQDCTLLFEVLLCHAGCESDDDDEDDECMAALGATFMFDCMLDYECYVAVNGSLGNIFKDDSACDTTLFCSPTMFQAQKDAYCAANTCPDSFNTFFNALVGCHSAECPFVHCSDEISACEEDEDCVEDLLFVVHIEDDYNGAHDDDLMDIIIERYCDAKGGCHALLDTAYECVKNADCFHFSDDQCWEIECKDEIDACVEDGTCIDALIDGIGNETACKNEVHDGTYNISCPDCNDLDKRNYTTCGVEGKSGTSWDDYEKCSELCDDCGDGVINSGLKACGDGECGTTYVDLLTCVVPACPDDDGSDEDECFGQCWIGLIECMFNSECKANWQWVEEYFDEYGEQTAYAYSATEEITGCTFAELGALWAQGEEVAMAAVMQCRYWDIQQYCAAEGGCSAAFWNMVNCLMSTCWNIAETTAVPTTTVVETTEVTVVVETTEVPVAVETTEYESIESTEATEDGEPPRDSHAVNYNVFTAIFVLSIFSVIFSY